MILLKEKILKIDLMKIDTEGYEYGPSEEKKYPEN